MNNDSMLCELITIVTVVNSLFVVLISTISFSNAEKVSVLIWIQHKDVVEYYLSIRQAAGKILDSS